MPYRTNTHYTNRAAMQGVNNLASALFGDPSQQAQTEYTLSRAREIQQDARMKRDARRRAQTAAELFSRGDVRGGMSTLVGTGEAGYLDKVGDASLAFQATDPNATDDQLRRAFIGSGRNPSEDFATTAGRADQISGRDAAEAFREATGVQQLRNLSTPEGVAANRVQGGEMALEDAARLFDPYSVDQRIAAEAPDAPTAGRWRGYRDSGSGGDDDSGIDWLDAQRRQKLQGQLQTETLNQLIDLGLPMQDEAARTDLLPPGMLAEITGEAWTNMLSDLEGDRQPMPASSYVGRALANRIGGLDYTEDNANWLPWGEEELTIAPPAVRRPQTAPAGAPVNQGPIPNETVVDGYLFRGGNPNDPNSWVPVQ